ncbi:hypothetical protein VE00_00668 [Pseudogymnoascus sp. WSF 3629]|nr:hypothetical protein VE00_00668 [Pseudogymnoascus sp. WSF 3629]
MPQSYDQDAVMLDANATIESPSLPNVLPTFEAALRLFIQTTKIHLLRLYDGDINSLSFLHVTLVFLHLVHALNSTAFLHPPNHAAIEYPTFPIPEFDKHPSRLKLLRRTPQAQQHIVGGHEALDPPKYIIRPFPED